MMSCGVRSPASLTSAWLYQDSMIYYQDDKITIYHGDCLDIMPNIGKFDLLLTDPPYGINLGKTKGTGGSHGMVFDAYESYDDTYENFVDEIVPRLNRAIEICDRGIVWTGPHIHEQRKPNCIGGVYCPAGAGRHGWGFKTFLPVLLYGNGPEIHKGAPYPTVIKSGSKPEQNGHPCPKPLEWIKWCVNLGSREGGTIIDPFAGSGTTGRAAKDLGRKCILIEREERYCEIAAKRMAQEVLF